MKNIVIVSVLCSLMVATAAFADSSYSPATQLEYANRYTQQAADAARQMQNDAQQTYQNAQQIYQQGQQVYQQGQQAVQNVQQTYQNMSGAKLDPTNVQQSGQSYVDNNVQPIRQKTQEVSNSWSNQAADWQAKADANQRAWDQTIRSYEVNYIESYARNWDKFTDAYQKSKKL